MELSPEEKMLTIVMSTAARTHRKKYMGSCRVESIQITVIMSVFPNRDVAYMAL